jgi:uncharacterized DUF497 family protein
VELSFDPAKSERNAAERGLPFELAAEFDFGTALVWPNMRFDFGETRLVGLGVIRERLHALVFVPLVDGTRVISLRKANAREQKLYERRSGLD